MGVLLHVTGIAESDVEHCGDDSIPAFPTSTAIKPENATVKPEFFTRNDVTIALTTVNNVSIFTAKDTHLSIEEMRTLACMVREKKINRVMILDTCPSYEICDLVRQLKQAGADIIFKDHHLGDYEGQSDSRLQAHKIISRLVGSGFSSNTREEVPCMMQEVTCGEAVKKDVGLIIALPVDADAVGAALKAAGLPLGRILDVTIEGDEARDSAAELMVAAIDSPGTQAASQAWKELNKMGVQELDIAFLEFLSAQTYTRIFPDMAQKLMLAVACFARDGSNASEEAQELEKCGIRAGIREKIVNNITKDSKFCTESTDISVIDLDVLAREGKMRLPDCVSTEAGKAELELLIDSGPGRFNMDDFSHSCFRMHKGEDGNRILAIKYTDPRTRQRMVFMRCVGNLMNNHGREGAGFNFKNILKELASKGQHVSALGCLTGRQLIVPEKEATLVAFEAVREILKMKSRHFFGRDEFAGYRRPSHN